MDIVSICTENCLKTAVLLIMVSNVLKIEICIGEVVNVSVDENILDKNGKIDLTKFQPICYDCDTHGYYKLGEKVGQAFADGLKLK